jgi:alkanesulfonate monooxygenase SsuD/methylene tetrahydromethanopterin reductase-like flavin-dependent oxidoreductase (luciferase family)
MFPKIGYLLPTREQIMEGRPETGPLIALSERAETLGYDSVWVGDSLLARPRHEPLTLLAGVATRTRRMKLGTAVLLPALRNPVVLAHQIATLDQLSEGRVILGVGIGLDLPNVHAEFKAAGVPFEKRAGRMTEGLRLCRALWTGKPVEWDGRWQVRGGTLAPQTWSPSGPPIWVGGTERPSRVRAGRWFDGWMPISPSPSDWAKQWTDVEVGARDAGRDPTTLCGAMYLTISVDDDTKRADGRLNEFLEYYYGQPGLRIRSWQACYAGSASGVATFLADYAEAGVTHFVLRFVGEHERHLEAVSAARATLGW